MSIHSNEPSFPLSKQELASCKQLLLWSVEYTNLKFSKSQYTQEHEKSQTEHRESRLRDVAEDPHLGTYSDRGLWNFLLLINILHIITLCQVESASGPWYIKAVGSVIYYQVNYRGIFRVGPRRTYPRNWSPTYHLFFVYFLPFFGFHMGWKEKRKKRMSDFWISVFCIFRFQSIFWASLAIIRVLEYWVGISSDIPSFRIY